MLEPIILPDLEEIRVRMQKANMKPRELALLCEVETNTIHKYLNGTIKDPPYGKVKQIFEILNDRLDLVGEPPVKTANEIMTRIVEYVGSDDLIERARDIMIRGSYSQLPVIDDGEVLGSITEDIMIKPYVSLKRTVNEIMGPKFPIQTPRARLQDVRVKLLGSPAVLIRRETGEYGIITKFDLIKHLTL